MILQEIKDGETFKNVECVLVDFRKVKDVFELTLQDRHTVKQAYLKANLYDFKQIKELKGKTVQVSGLHEDGIPGVIAEKIKVKAIQLKSEEKEDLLKNYPHLEAGRLAEIIQLIKKYVTYVGREVPAYRQLLELVYGNGSLLKKMETMPATHIRQGSPLGGMLHATLAVTELAYNNAMHYISCANGVYSFKSKKSLNWDLLLTAALLHLTGNFIYYDENIPHNKTNIGVEQGFSNCRQQFILKLAMCNHVPISDEDMSALLGVMARLNEQTEGVQKCRHEAYFLEAAYNLFQQVDSFDCAVADYLKEQKENADKEEGNTDVFTQHVFLPVLNRYVSSDEILRKADMMGYLTEEESRKEEVPC